MNSRCYYRFVTEAKVKCKRKFFYEKGYGREQKLEVDTENAFNQNLEQDFLGNLSESRKQVVNIINFPNHNILAFPS